MSKQKFWPIVVVILVLAGSWKIYDVLKQPPKTSTKFIPSVVTQPVKQITKDNSKVFAGSIEAREEALICGKVSGRVSDVLVKNGDAVRKGSPVVQLETSDYQSALESSRGMLKKAEAQLASARTTYDRTLVLQKEGAASIKDLEDADNALKAAEGDFAAANAAVTSASDALHNTTIATPISGVVANRNVTLGQGAEAGLPLMTVEDLTSVYAVINVDQKQLGQFVKTGTRAKVSVDGFSETFQGSVESINPAAASGARLFETRITVPNPKKLLRPGMYARVFLINEVQEKVLAVPQTSLVSQEGLYFVYLFEQGKVKRQEVKIGDVIGQMVEIKSGLKPGQEITVSNVNKLKDGERVKVIR